ncbi:hypothetical protein GCM10010470_33610 [Saccharopolyspora taberi]|uniref:Diguanylate cyclase n=1 Tax=Saccharopolyspora taberi TaxID=60895 RepID=A0ABN3VE15_9PSEU
MFYVMFGSALTLVYYALPTGGGWGPARVVVYFAISASAVPAIVLGMRAHRPVPPWPWLFIGISQLIFALADASFYTAHLVFGITTFPFVADVLYICHYPVVVTGLALLIGRRSPRRDLPNLLDAALLAVVAAMLSWLYLIEPYVQAGAPQRVSVASLAYPVLDLVLFAVALRLILSSGRRPTAFFLLAFNLAAFVTADTFYVVQQIGGVYGPGTFLDAVWLSGNIALGAAGLHPTMAALGEPAPHRDMHLASSRVVALAAAALVAPGVLLVQHFRGASHDVPVIAAACAVLFLLTITRLAVMVSQQRRLAVTDVLTGLRTRRYFEASLCRALARCTRPPAVFVIDIDRFKAINDRYGHPAGDGVLVEVATRLRGAARDGDVLARYGGEEFALLAFDVEPEAVPAIAERLRAAVAGAPVRVSDEDRLPVTVSVGAACAGRTTEELIAEADRALYAAKAQGRDRVTVGDPGTDHAAALAYLRSTADQVDGLLSTCPHGRPVGRWARLVCERLGCDRTTAANAELAGRLHDIGKILIPPEVLAKPSALTEAEWGLLRQHPDHGFRLINAVPGLDEIAAIVRQHHERVDGAGYPRGLAGNAIRLEARVISVCDAWATMVSDRPYATPRTPEDAAEQLRLGRGSQFDADVVDAFLALHAEGQIEALWERAAL